MGDSQVRQYVQEFGFCGRGREGGNSIANKLPNYVQKFGLCTVYSEWGGGGREGGNGTSNKLPNNVKKFGLCTVSGEAEGGRKKYCKQVAELLLILLHLLLFRAVFTCNGIII
jgi:hypothetical protein